MSQPPISPDDREHMVRNTTHLWPELSGAHFFVTGGTGFYGKWLLESIAAANDLLGAGVSATILSRDPARFYREAPHLAARREFSWLTGDTADFRFPATHFEYVLHFATASAAEVVAGGTATILQTLHGTERVLQFARSNGARRLLFASSGAVYGRQPAELSHIPEDHRGGPDLADAGSTYGELKRISEIMCSSSGIDCVITRGFAFVGPYLPLTEKFAMGSFIRDALSRGPIRIHGDGRSVRSYLYAADLVIWLLTLLLKGKPNRPYNIGSDQAISLAGLAQHVAATTDASAVQIALAPTPGPAERYVPEIQRARIELGLDVLIPLSLALRRTVDWAQREFKPSTH